MEFWLSDRRNYQGPSAVSWQLDFEPNRASSDMDRPSDFDRHKIAENRIRQVNAGHPIKNKESPQTRMVRQHLKLRLRPPLQSPSIQPRKAPDNALNLATSLPKIILQRRITDPVRKQDPYSH